MRTFGTISRTSRSASAVRPSDLATAEGTASHSSAPWARAAAFDPAALEALAYRRWAAVCRRARQRALRPFRQCLPGPCGAPHRRPRGTLARRDRGLSASRSWPQFPSSLRDAENPVAESRPSGFDRFAMSSCNNPRPFRGAPPPVHSRGTGRPTVRDSAWPRPYCDGARQGRSFEHRDNRRREADAPPAPGLRQCLHWERSLVRDTPSKPPSNPSLDCRRRRSADCRIAVAQWLVGLAGRPPRGTRA